MSSLEILDVITYVCAVLGGLLLFLCVVLASILIYLQCRRYFFPGSTRYAIVPAGAAGDPVASALENGEASKNRTAGGGEFRSVPVATVSAVSESNSGCYSKPQARQSSSSSAPVKKKMKWRRGRKKSFTEVFGGGARKRGAEDEESVFTDDDLDVPKEGLFKKNRRATRTSGSYTIVQPRMSKSDWDLSSGEEEAFLLRDMRGRGGGEGGKEDREDVGKSQYFDALETIDETMEEFVETDSDNEEKQQDANLKEEEDEWEDVAEYQDDGALKGLPVENSLQLNRFLQQQEAGAMRQQRTGRRRSTAAMSELPRPVRRRVAALRRLHMERQEVEAGFHRELHKLEKTTLLTRLRPLFDARARIVRGDASAAAKEGEGEGKERRDLAMDGVPMFWAHAMLSSRTLRNIVQTHDIPVLRHLRDVRVRPDPDSKGEMDFRLEFVFGRNDFFSDRVLTKDYEVRMPETSAASDRTSSHFEGPEVVNCRGCKVHWAKGKNVTLRPVKKAQKNGEVVQKWAKRNSFFNFFTPPRVTRENCLDVRMSVLLDAHFDVGLYLKEIFVPRATTFFMSGEVLDLRGSSSSGGGGGAGSASNRSSYQTQERRRVSDYKSKPAATSVPLPSSSSSRPQSPPNNRPGTATAKEETVSQEDAEAKMADQEEKKEEEKPGPDPILGRYKLAESEGFDEFMKALGVGIIKRKMANAAVPVVVVEIQEDGTYVIRTETPIRTSEIKFKLDESFKETTLDGRVTDTTATRNGNVLSLDQKGDAGRKEKDSTMVRDFRGDRFLMEMTVDDVVCKRTYQKIAEE